jgi:hypothetical protein
MMKMGLRSSGSLAIRPRLRNDANPRPFSRGAGQTEPIGPRQTKPIGSCQTSDNTELAESLPMRLARGPSRATEPSAYCHATASSRLAGSVLASRLNPDSEPPREAARGMACSRQRWSRGPGSDCGGVLLDPSDTRGTTTVGRGFRYPAAADRPSSGRASHVDRPRRLGTRRAGAV